MKNDEGVSEAIGFILIFSIVVLGIAIVVLYGFPLLVTGQGSADMRNMEQTMIVLQNDLKSISYKMVPYKETALQVQGGVLFVTEASGTFEVLIDGDSKYNGQVGQIRYVSDLDRTRITIENGAVLTRPERGSGSAMITEPRWYYDDFDDILILSFIEIETERERALAGVGRIEMKVTDIETTEIKYPPEINVTVNVRESPDPGDDYSVAWGNYMTGRLEMTSDGAGGYLRSNVKRLVIKRTVITITGF